MLKNKTACEAADKLSFTRTASVNTINPKTRTSCDCTNKCNQ